MTTDPSKSFLHSMADKKNPQLFLDGVEFYLSRFVAAINDGCTADMPCMVAALRMAEKAIRESEMWKDNPFSEMVAEMLSLAVRPQFAYARLPSEGAIKDEIEKLRKKDSGDVQEEV